MRFHPLATALGITFLCALAVGYAMRTPRPVAASAPPREFSAERAMAHVRELTTSPRPPGSEGHQRALVYIMSRIAGVGLEPLIQPTTGVGTRYPVAGRVRNIVARVPGTLPSSSGALLLVAHWDGVAAGPAASDDASGVAVLLETLRAIRAGPLLRRDVIALFTDSEEAGLLGAAAFAREHPWAKDVGVILNFEARGTNGPSLMFETGAANYDIVNVLRRVRGARATSLSTAVYRQLPNDTDLSELAMLDRQAMNFAFIGGVERYHTSEDDVSHLSTGSLQHHGNQALGLVRILADVELPRRSDRGDGVFFDLPLIGIVLYPESWALPFAVLALAVCGVALVLAARRRGSDYLIAAVGAVALLLSLVVAAFAAAGAATLLLRLHSALPWGGAPQWRGIYAAALTFLTIAIVTSAFALTRRLAHKERAIEAGALIMAAVLNVLVTVVIPGASFLLTWPVFAASACAIVEAGMPRAIGLAIRWAATALILVILTPTIYLMVCVALGLDVVGAGALAVLSAVGGWLIVRHVMDGSERPWRVPLAAAAISLALFVTGIFTVRTNAAHPAAATFVYATDSATGAWLAGGATNGWARSWLERELRLRGDSSRASGAPAWLARSFALRRIVPAPVVPVPSPSVSVLDDSLGTNARIVRVRVRAPGARSIQMSAEPGAVVWSRVDDRDVRVDRYRARSRRWSLEYVAPSDSGFTLTLAMRLESEHAISLIARHSGFPLGVPVPIRPPGIIRIGAGDVTHVYRRVDLRPPP